MSRPDPVSSLRLAIVMGPPRRYRHRRPALMARAQQRGAQVTYVDTFDVGVSTDSRGVKVVANGQVYTPTTPPPWDIMLFKSQHVDVLRALEALGVPRFNTSEGTATGWDKYRGHLQLATPKTAFGRPDTPCPTVPMAFGVSAHARRQAVRAMAGGDGELVVKHRHSSQPSAIHSGWWPRLQWLALGGGHRVHQIAQPRIRPLGPTVVDYKAMVCGGRVLGIKRMAVAWPQWRTNSPTARHETLDMATPLARQMADLAVKAVGAFGLDYGSVDMVVARDVDGGVNPMIYEVNATPNFVLQPAWADAVLDAMAEKVQRLKSQRLKAHPPGSGDRGLHDCHGGAYCNTIEVAPTRRETKPA